MLIFWYNKDNASFQSKGHTGLLTAHYKIFGLPKLKCSSAVTITHCVCDIHPPDSASFSSDWGGKRDRHDHDAQFP